MRRPWFAVLRWLDQALPRQSDRVVQCLCQQLSRGEFRQVLGNLDAALIELQEFDVPLGLVGTQNEPQRRLLARLHLVFFQPPQVELHLPLVGRPETAELEVDGYQPPQAAVIEQQVEVVILVVNSNPLLPRDEGKIGPQFQEKGFQLPENGPFHVPLVMLAGEPQEVQQVGIPEDEVGSHPVGIAESIKFVSDEVLGLFADRRSFEQHAVDLVPQGTYTPAFEAAHLSVEIPLEGIGQRQDGQEVAPTQLL